MLEPDSQEAGYKGFLDKYYENKEKPLLFKLVKSRNTTNLLICQIWESCCPRIFHI